MSISDSDLWISSIRKGVHPSSITRGTQKWVLQLHHGEVIEKKELDRCKKKCIQQMDHSIETPSIHVIYIDLL